MPVDEQIMSTLRIPREEAPVARLLGMRLASAGPGIATFTMQVDERHHNPMGSVHGGILGDLADAAMGYAVISTLAPDETFTTLEFKVNFLRPAFAGALRCQARVESRGKTIAYAVADVLNEEDKVVAKAVSTNLIVRRTGESDPFHHRRKA
ncbi:MAG TPA: PaaI family thioesterase [Candidatus Thermoplasmatota archaeon]|nr:PaaI family thioesterase [Candidatus Thermoplasmatota archaeon]